MSRSVTVFTSAATDGLPFVVDRDCSLRAILALASTVLVSKDPSLTYAGFFALAASGLDENFIGMSGFPNLADLNLNLRKGDIIYLSTGNPSSTQLLFDDVAELPNS